MIRDRPQGRAEGTVKLPAIVEGGRMTHSDVTRWR